MSFEQSRLPLVDSHSIFPIRRLALVGIGSSHVDCLHQASDSLSIEFDEIWMFHCARGCIRLFIAVDLESRCS
jgi:hypothetical protein